MCRGCDKPHVLRVQGLEIVFRQERAWEVEPQQERPSKVDVAGSTHPRPAPM